MNPLRSIVFAWRRFWVRRAAYYLERYNLSTVDVDQLDRLTGSMARALHSIETTSADVSQFKAHATHLYRSLRNNLGDAHEASTLLRARYYYVVSAKEDI